MSDLKHEEKIAEMMGYYQKGFPVQTHLDDEGLALCATMLAEYTIPQLNAATKKIIRTCKYFPSVAEICEAADSLAEHVSTEGKGVPDAGEAFREMIELFDYTLQKSSDRRHELHSIAVGMINRNVTKKNFKILKKHLSMIVSRKRENNEYFEYVQNYLNEVEQKIYN